MKNELIKTIKTTLLFVLITALLGVGVMEFYFEGENDFFQDSSAREELAGTLDYLMIGASHCKRGFDPRIIDEELGVNSYNLGSACLTMKARYELLQKELARNPVKTVVLEVSFDSIRVNRREFGDEGELYYMGRIDSLPERFSYFFTSFYPEEYVSAVKYFLSKGVESMKLLLHGKYVTHYESATNYKGCKFYETPARDQTIDYAKMYKTIEADTTPDPENAEYLQKMVDLCKSYNTEIFLIDVPVSKKLICEYTGYDEVRAWYADFAEKNGLEFYDFNLLKNRDELFSDVDSFWNDQHLHNEAMDVFTEQYVTAMKRRAAGEDISEMFYSSYDEYEKTQEYFIRQTDKAGKSI